MSRSPLVIQCEHLHPEAARWLSERCRLVVLPDGGDPAAAIADAEGLLVRTHTRVDDALLGRADRLRVVGRSGAGLDNIDVAACRRRGIEVVYTPDANTQAVVEYVVALLGDALRPRTEIREAVDLERWNALRAEHLAGSQMNELTLGVLGLGRIGRRVAQVAGAIGFDVLYHDLLEIAPLDRHGATPVSCDRLFAASDVLTVHIDGRPSNHRFIAAPLLGRLKEHAILINTSRGSVVDNVALAEFLTTHPHARAHLDVHDPEPFDATYPLLDLPGAHLYPHLASRTRTAERGMSGVVKDVVAVLEGRPPRWPAPGGDMGGTEGLRD